MEGDEPSPKKLKVLCHAQAPQVEPFPPSYDTTCAAGNGHTDSSAMQPTEAIASFYSLPIESILEVFKHLSLKGLQSASIVCRAWNSVYMEETLWKTLVDMRFMTTYNIGLPKRKLIKTWRKVFNGCLRFFSGEEVDNCPWCASKYVDLLGDADEPVVVCRVCYFSASVTVCHNCTAMNTHKSKCACNSQFCEVCGWKCGGCGWRCGKCTYIPSCSGTRYCVECSPPRSSDDAECDNTGSDQEHEWEPAFDFSQTTAVVESCDDDQNSCEAGTYDDDIPSNIYDNSSCSEDDV